MDQPSNGALIAQPLFFLVRIVESRSLRSPHPRADSQHVRSVAKLSAFPHFGSYCRDHYGACWIDKERSRTSADRKQLTPKRRPSVDRRKRDEVRRFTIERCNTGRGKRSDSSQFF